MYPRIRRRFPQSKSCQPDVRKYLAWPWSSEVKKEKFARPNCGALRQQPSSEQIRCHGYLLDSGLSLAISTLLPEPCLLCITPTRPAAPFRPSRWTTPPRAPTNPMALSIASTSQAIRARLRWSSFTISSGRSSVCGMSTGHRPADPVTSLRLCRELTFWPRPWALRSSCPISLGRGMHLE